MSDINQARYEARYDDALARAVHHGRQLRTVAEVAVSRLSELEAEVASLRAACQQRQDVIAMLKGRIMSVYGDMTDDEFILLRERHGDIVYEVPSIALALLNDLRQAEPEVLLAEVEEVLRRQERRKLH